MRKFRQRNSPPPPTSKFEQIKNIYTHFDWECKIPTKYDLYNTFFYQHSGQTLEQSARGFAPTKGESLITAVEVSRITNVPVNP